MNNINILPMVWKDVKNKKVLSWLDKDQLQAIILDNNIYWYEQNQIATFPKYARKYLDNLLAKKGYKYLYNL